MPADWTASGACTSGSTAPPRDATRPGTGCATTTRTTSAEPSPGARVDAWGRVKQLFTVLTTIAVIWYLFNVSAPQNDALQWGLRRQCIFGFAKTVKNSGQPRCYFSRR